MLNPYDIYITPEEYEIAAAHGVSARMLDRRVRQQDWPKQKAMTTPPRKQKPRGYFTKWLAIAKKNGIGRDSFHNRVRNGWSLEDAATKPLPTPEEIRKQALHATNHARVHPEHYLRLAESNGIQYHTFHNRVKNCGWDYERAATEPVWSSQQRGKLGAKRLREREGDWAALIFGTGEAIR